MFHVVLGFSIRGVNGIFQRPESKPAQGHERRVPQSLPSVPIVNHTFSPLRPDVASAEAIEGLLAPFQHTSELQPPAPNPIPSTDLDNLPSPTIASASTPDDNCSQCSIIYESVYVFFPPALGSSTGCVNEAVTPPSPTRPPDLHVYVHLERRYQDYLPTDQLHREPGSVYAIIPTLSAGNMCTKIFEAFSLTFSFAPGQLSTIQGPDNITKEFNFADVRCPPPDIASDVLWFYNPTFNPTRPYEPVVAPFSQLYELDDSPAFQQCTVGLNQGFDPSGVVEEANGPTIPKFGRLGPHLGARGGPMNAHKVPQAPAQTNSAGLSRQHRRHNPGGAHARGF